MGAGADRESPRMGKQRLLIIGASGFLGSNAFEHSTDKFDVIRADRYRSSSGAEASR